MLVKIKTKDALMHIISCIFANNIKSIILQKTKRWSPPKSCKIDLKFANCNFFIYINNYNINIILKKGRYEKNNIKVIGFNYVIKI